MSKGVNKCLIIGRLGQAPELRTTQSGTQITTVSVATSEAWRDKQTGQQQERTEWHRIIFFNRLAEIASQYLKKGSKVYVEGSLRTRKWTDNQGVERYTTEIIASEMQMLDSRESDDYQGHSGSNQQNPAYQQPAPQQAQGGAPQQSSGFDDFDDNIPF